MIRNYLAGLSVLLAASSVVSAAGSLRVAPTRLDLPAVRRAVAVTVTNTGSAPTLLQLEPRRWSQPGGQDDYAAAGEIIVSPPIFTLDPGAEQIVRVARRDGPAPESEQAYRLFIQEVPTPDASATRELNVVLRVGVPVFLTPELASEAVLEWKLTCGNSMQPVLQAANRGGRALRIDELTINAEGVSHVEHAVYVLAGATRLLPLMDVPAEARRVEVRALSGSRELLGSATCD